ncbi:hypothetical protein ACFYRN_25085 [Streptomyces sp. NPDC005227]|uniref:hypothetical protein n=1 Tax=Streptomyces sp. NPDC005227 TaxID=3364707 RepID=UPI0036878A4D
MLTPADQPAHRRRPGAIMGAMARSNYEPPADAARLFANNRRAVLALDKLRGPLRETAVREMRAGATIGDLARLTGYSNEFFRRLAREAGIERRRPPTRGRNSDPSD